MNDDKGLKRRYFIRNGVILYLCWLAMLVTANTLMREAETSALGGVLYYLGVILIGIVLPAHSCLKLGISIPILPEWKSPVFWMTTAVFFAGMVFLGIQAMADFGLGWADVLRGSLWHVLSTALILLNTMIAYTMLWYGYFYRGILEFWGGGARSRIAAVPDSYDSSPE